MPKLLHGTLFANFDDLLHLPEIQQFTNRVEALDDVDRNKSIPTIMQDTILIDIVEKHPNTFTALEETVTVMTLPDELPWIAVEIPETYIYAPVPVSPVQSGFAGYIIAEPTHAYNFKHQ